MNKPLIEAQGTIKATSLANYYLQPLGKHNRATQNGQEPKNNTNKLETAT